jgi:hypothetical protein
MKSDNMNKRKQIVTYLGAGILGVSVTIMPSDAFALASVEFAIKEICNHMQGNLGGLLMATAGVGGLISAAFGNMKAMYSCVVTAVGAFTISSMLSLHFESAARLCSSDDAGAPGAHARMSKNRPADESDYSRTAEVSRFNVEQAVKTYIDKSNTAVGTNPGTDASLDKYVDSSHDESDMELF